MDIDNPASTPEDDDIRSAIEKAWDDTEAIEEGSPVAEAEAGQAEEKASDYNRDERGRFAAKEAEEAAKAVEQAAQAQQPPAEQQATEQQPEQAAPVMRPPPGWSVAAKAQFDNLPPEVREAVANREQEVNQGFAKLAEYKAYDPYIETARNSGTTLNEALDRYMAAEQLLERDFFSGIAHLCQTYNVHPAQLAAVFGAQQGGNQNPQGQPYAPIMQEISALRNELGRIQQEREQAEAQSINGQIEAFANDPANRYFDNVKGQMAILLQSGQCQDLKDAYDTACWMNAEIRELRIKEAQAPAIQQRAKAVDQARKASKSLPTGAPAHGASTRTGSSDTVRGAIEEAMASLSASI